MTQNGGGSFCDFFDECVDKRGHILNALIRLQDFGQSLWIEHVTRERLRSGLFRKKIEEWRVTGLTIDTAACELLLRTAQAYDPIIIRKLDEGTYGGALALDLVLDETRFAADLLRPAFERTDGMDGWAALPMSPLLVADPGNLTTTIKELHTRTQRSNILISIPGLPEYMKAIEEAFFAGVPLNVTLLFSREQYLEAARAYLRGVERRIAAGLDPVVGSFASIPVAPLISALCAKLQGKCPIELVRAIARRIYTASLDLKNSRRWEHANNAGTRPQRLLWDNTTSCKTSGLFTSTIRYLVAPLTVAAMTENTLETFAASDDTFVSMPAYGDDCEEVIGRYSEAGIDLETLTARLQKNEAETLITLWIELLDAVARRSAELTTK